MADFSHLSIITPALVARFRELNEDKVPTDDMLFEALQNIDPPLLEEPAQSALNHILQGRRGRPAKSHPDREELISIMTGIERSDVPQGFLDALSARLRQPRRVTDLKRAIQTRRLLDARDQENFICGLYPEIYLLLEPKAAVIGHPILGELPVPAEPATRSERAAEMTRQVLNEKLEMDPPSPRTILNIVSQRRRTMAKIKSARKT